MSLVPAWLAPYAAVSELLFLAVSLLVAILAFRVYRMSENRLAFSIGVGFSLLAASHVLRAAFELLSLATVVQCGTGFFSHCRLLAFAEWTHMGAAIAAFALIAYVTLRPKRLEPALLLVALALVPLFLSASVFAYAIVSSVLLAYLSVFFGLNAYRRRSMLSIVVFFGFLSLFISALVTALWSHNLVALVFHFIGYGSILVNYVMVLQR